MSEPIPAIVVRNYSSAEAFAKDATSMAGAGWMPVMQTETTGGINGSAVTLLIIGIVVGLVLSPLGWLVALVGLILAVVMRGKALVVTYRPDMAKPPVAEATGDVVAEPV